MNADQFRIELDNIKNQMVNKFNPKEIVLFGSLAKGTFRSNSDIDLCIIKDTDNKRDLITKIYTEID
ncbi:MULTISPECIES: nucleotidyltransferase family protein [Clostridium]|nr:MULTISPECIES: nucleotidyltransferase domain-containing protein [Clostridium]MDB2157112.1 nucleotidyltransferase domain-containing protein [Clostridium butyricum]MDU1117457.1 nucleotidyltransferase domain-containing protein [Clostridium sp.]MDU1604654.1 nucleotidyltransferase domain-containing protein [Clostridium sp.]MDU2896279.1 nucleotidyltransferase domain-containing protein [Clostridium sp.]MDU3008930.1 nucleotidyltransferase domain-containing protein [Clostridium sp.]